MEPIDESMEISQEKVQQPGDLLENSWFFNNLFNTKKRPPTTIPRCYSDPSPSSSSSNFTDHHQDYIFSGKSMEETFSAINKLPEKAGRMRSSSQPAGLMRAESAPQRVVRKSSLQRCSNNLSRAPSLPASMAIREEIQDEEEESDFSMSRLIRQASLNQSDLLPPRSSPKVVTQSNSTPKQRTRTRLDSESVNTKSSGSAEGVRRQQHHHHQNQMNRTTTRLGRSSSDMGFQEFQGLKELSIEKNKEPSSSAKEWPEQSRTTSSSSSQVTEQWVDRRSVEEDMKAQIKFWARAVASNVK